MTRLARTARPLRREDGITLVEQLVVMVIALIVLFAVLETADTGTRSSAANSRLTDAEDRMRTQMGEFVRELREAPPINAAAAAGDARWAGLHRRGVAADHGRSLVRNGARNGYQRGPLTSPPTRALAPAV